MINKKTQISDPLIYSGLSDDEIYELGAELKRQLYETLEIFKPFFGGYEEFEKLVKAYNAFCLRLKKEKRSVE